VGPDILCMRLTRLSRDNIDDSSALQRKPIRFKGARTKRYYTSYGPIARNLVIPAEDNNAEVVGEVTVAREVTLVYAQPHMHLRGKDYELRAIYPNGEAQTLFKSKWDFNWQLGYNFDQAVILPEGTRLLRDLAFRQLTREPVQPGSYERDSLGTPELGRGEQLLSGPCL